MPAAAMPAPMAAMPMPVPVMSPAHLFWFKTVHFARGSNGRTRRIPRRQPFIWDKWMRRKRRGLRARGQRRGAGGCSESDFQKVAAFHDISSNVRDE